MRNLIIGIPGLMWTYYKKLKAIGYDKWSEQVQNPQRQDADQLAVLWFKFILEPKFKTGSFFMFFCHIFITIIWNNGK